MHVPCPALLAAAVVAAMVSVSVVAAQDNDSAAPSPDAAQAGLDAAPDASDAKEQWMSLLRRRQEVAEGLARLKGEFATASADEKLQIRGEFEKLVNEFNDELQPAMQKLAAEVFAADPAETSAGEFVVDSAFNANQYARAAEVAEKLMASGRTNAHLASLAGVSRFAQHEFDKAVTLLEVAQRNDDVDAELGGRYLPAAREYARYWKSEQKIRDAEARATVDQQLPRVALKTSSGDIMLELFENEAPNSVANFIELVEAGAYNGTRFHRVIQNFMVQGGDPNSKDDDPFNDGNGGPGYTIKCECHGENARRHFTGSLSMAHAGRDTGGSQFFITHLPTDHLNGRHTVFGRVVDGMQVVWSIRKGDAIESATVVRKRAHEYKAQKTPEP